MGVVVVLKNNIGVGGGVGWSYVPGRGRNRRLDAHHM